MLNEVLRNTPAYQRILQGGREKDWKEEAQQLILNASEDREQNN